MSRRPVAIRPEIKHVKQRPMFHVLIDTCVWLDLATVPSLSPHIASIEELVREGQLRLIVPRVVMDEFQRNKERIAKNVKARLSQQFRDVKQAIKNAESNSRRQRSVIKYLSEIDHKIPVTSGQPAAYLKSIERLMSKAGVLETTDSARLKAADRAISKAAAPAA
jgi:hypothetical protein